MMKRLVFRGGIDTEKTASLNSGGWSVSNAIRWRETLVESLRGFIQVVAVHIQGIARALHYWADLSGISWLAIGSNTNLYVETGGALMDITPAAFVPGAVSSPPKPPFSLLVWSLDNFGQNLIAVPSGQAMFQWIPPAGPITKIAAAPAKNNGMLVLDQLQVVMAWGCTPLGGGANDAMLVRWCDQSDVNDWTASTTNQAGSYRLPHGSRIIAGLQVPGLALIWTDIGVWGVQYIGFPLVFSFQSVGQNCGAISQKAIAVLGQVVYWMSDHGFFRLSGGGPEQMPCTVWDVVFLNIDESNQDKCLAAPDYHFSEIWFFYPSMNGASGEIDSYAKINIAEGLWDYGPASPGLPNVFARTAWTDQNQPGRPISVSLQNLLVQADNGFTLNGDGPVPATVTSGYMDLAEGEYVLTFDTFYPDFKWDGVDPSVDVTFYFRDSPGTPVTSSGPYRVTPTSENISLRLPKVMTIAGTTVTAYPAPRGREVAMQITSVSGWWRLGNCRIDGTAPAGTLP